MQRAFNRAHDDKRSLETLDALLDLSAKVFAFHRDKGESLCDRWREIVRRESKALAAKARCRMTEKNTPPAILSFREAGADQIRVLLGLYVESITKSKQPADADPVNVLAKRIAGDCAEAAEEVADLIRYLTFNGPKDQASARTSYPLHPVEAEIAIRSHGDPRGRGLGADDAARRPGRGREDLLPFLLRGVMLGWE